MAHKLAHRWKVFTMDDEQDPPELVRIGIMDLMRMSDLGILAEGEYEEFETTSQFRIRGVAVELGGLMQLSLENLDRPGERWQGLLIYEKGAALKLGGSRFVPEELRKLVDQEEEPWIITKP